MIRRFRARVHVFSTDRLLQAEAECLLAVELAPFSRTRWSGTLTNAQPRVPSPGRYLLRFPNGRSGEIDLGAGDLTGCPFTGLGTLPMP